MFQNVTKFITVENENCNHLLKQMLIICFSQAREPVCFSNCIQLSPSCEVGRSIINGYLTNGDHVLNSSDVSDWVFSLDSELISNIRKKGIISRSFFLVYLP